MASNRINRINEEIQKSVAEKLRTVKDPRVSDTMISVTRVETTPDLRYAKVYVSFLEADKAAEAMKGLKSAGGYLRREVGSDLKLRAGLDTGRFHHLRRPYAGYSQPSALW